MAQEPILNLSTLAPDRPKVIIDGYTYEIAVVADLGILSHHRIKQLHPSLEAYSQANASGEDPPEELVIAAVSAMEEFTKIVLLGATHELIHKLSDEQRVQIIGVFTAAAGWSPTEETRPKRKARRRTTGRSSPGSNGTMEETPSVG